MRPGRVLLPLLLLLLLLDLLLASFAAPAVKVERDARDPDAAASSIRRDVPRQAPVELERESAGEGRRGAVRWRRGEEGAGGVLVFLRRRPINLLQ